MNETAPILEKIEGLQAHLSIESDQETTDIIRDDLRTAFKQLLDLVLRANITDVPAECKDPAFLTILNEKIDALQQQSDGDDTRRAFDAGEQAINAKNTDQLLSHALHLKNSLTEENEEVIRDRKPRTGVTRTSSLRPELGNGLGAIEGLQWGKDFLRELESQFPNLHEINPAELEGTCIGKTQITKNSGKAMWHYITSPTIAQSKNAEKKPTPMIVSLGMLRNGQMPKTTYQDMTRSNRLDISREMTREGDISPWFGCYLLVTDFTHGSNTLASYAIESGEPMEPLDKGELFPGSQSYAFTPVSLGEAIVAKYPNFPNPRKRNREWSGIWLARMKPHEMFETMKEINFQSELEKLAASGDVEHLIQDYLLDTNCSFGILQPKQSSLRAINAGFSGKSRGKK